MEKHTFKFVLEDNIARQLNRKGYKAAMSWLRLCRREIEERIDFDRIAEQTVRDLALYGTSVTML